MSAKLKASPQRGIGLRLQRLELTLGEIEETWDGADNGAILKSAIFFRMSGWAHYYN